MQATIGLTLQLRWLLPNLVVGSACRTATRTPPHLLHWQCEQRHTWWANLNNVKSGGTWCPTCAGRPPLTLAAAREVAANQGGELLSQSYDNVRGRLHWRCAQGHEWLTTLDSVRNKGSWCPSCARSRRRLKLGLAHQLASAQGGLCLSKSYTNNCSRLLWRCSHHHEWWASLKSVKDRGTWCPSCASGRREREVRHVFGARCHCRFGPMILLSIGLLPISP